MKKLLYLLFLTAFWGCTSAPNTEKHQYTRNNIIKVEDKLVEIDMDSLMFSNIVIPYLMNDYLLIADYKSFDQLIHVFDKNTFRYITGFGYRGQGPGEIASLGHLGIDIAHGKLDVPDFAKQIIYSFDLDSVFADPFYMPDEKLKIHGDKFLDYYQYLNDSICIGLIFEPISHSDFQFAVGKQNMHTGEFELMPNMHPEIKRKRVTFDVSLENKIYVECYSEQNLMTICTLDGELKYNIYGNHNWKDNRNGRINFYTGVSFVGDKIFTLYLNGNAYRKDPAKGMIGNSATKFQVFNLNGDYIATLETNKLIRYFCYDQDNNRLILCMDDEMQFAYLELDGLIDV